MRIIVLAAFVIVGIVAEALGSADTSVARPHGAAAVAAAATPPTDPLGAECSCEGCEFNWNTLLQHCACGDQWLSGYCEAYTIPCGPTCTGSSCTGDDDYPCDHVPAALAAYDASMVSGDGSLVVLRGVRNELSQGELRRGCHGAIVARDYSDERWDAINRAGRVLTL